MRLRRILFAIPAVALAAFAWRDAAVAYWLSVNPEDAPSLVGSDPRLALAASDVTVRDQNVPGLAFWQAMPDKARDALRAAPLNAVAVREIGLAADATGKPGLSNYLALAERISRRDVPTQVTLLRLAAEENRYEPSFRHLDILLTTEPTAGGQFYPALAQLLSDPRARGLMARYGDRPWFADFTAAAIKETSDPVDLARLLVESRTKLSDADGTLLPRLLGRLVDTGDYAAARDFAVGFGGARAAALADFALTAATTDPRFAPLTWQLAQSEAVQSGLNANGALEVEVRPGSPVEVAERVTHLAPGPYVIEQKADRSDTGGELLVSWELRCSRDGEMEIAWQQPLKMTGTPTQSRSRVDVPAGCPVQLWRLTALADDTQSDADFRIAGLRLASGS